MFHATYLLVSPPGFNKLPSEFVHAHNYFVHQGVELGFLGLIASLGVFSAVVLVGGYQMLRLRKGDDVVYQLLLIGVVAIIVGRLLEIVGRLLEQMVGIARVSDLTIFWMLLGVSAALPAIMEAREGALEPESQPPRRRSRSNRSPANNVLQERPQQNSVRRSIGFDRLCGSWHRSAFLDERRKLRAGRNHCRPVS